MLADVKPQSASPTATVVLMVCGSWHCDITSVHILCTHMKYEFRENGESR